MRNIIEKDSLLDAAESLCAELKKSWTDPFFSPVVIFPDIKLEQWFRLYWIKNYGTLANLNTRRLNEFMRNIIPSAGEAGNLSLNVLADAVLSYFYLHIESLSERYVELDSYFHTDGNIDHGHVFDLSRQLASVYLEYEISRPSDQASGTRGFMSMWKEGEFFFDGSEREKWQREIYCDIFYGDGPGANFISSFAGDSKTIARLFDDEKVLVSDSLRDGEGKVLPVYFFGFGKLGNIYEVILNEFCKTNDVTFFCTRREKECPENLHVKLVSAPSVIREVESLHSEIAGLIQQGVRFDQIAVVSPDMGSYRNAVYQIFSHEEEERSLDIPFRFLDSSAGDSLTEAALGFLFKLLEDDSITRPVFFSLIRNSVVRKARKISSGSVSEWRDWITNMNVYRDRRKKESDWKNGSYRLLLSRLTDESYDAGGTRLVPYSNLSSADDESLCGFTEAVRDLDALLSFRKKNETITSENSSQLKLLLDRWLLIDDDDENYAEEKFVYENVRKAIDGFDKFFSAGVNGLSWRTAESLVMESVEKFSYGSGRIFVDGVSFYDFAPNRIIPVDYLFFIGADSKVFPGKDSTNTLDLRNSVDRWEDDTSPSDRNKEAFWQQVRNTFCCMEISYRNSDLAKDEPLYFTNIINELEGKKEIEAVQINIDEDRDMKCLFTSRSMRSRELYVSLVNSAEEKKSVQHFDGECTNNPPEKVSVYQLSQFLEDPLKFRVSGISYREEEDSSAEEENFEPVGLGGLFISSAVKDLTNIRIQSDSPVTVDEYDKYIENTKVMGIIPDGVYGDLALDDVKGKVDCIFEQMKELGVDRAGELEYKKSIGELNLQISPGMTDRRWNLTGKYDWTLKTDSGKNTLIFVKIEANKKSDWTEAFVRALAFIAEQKKNSGNVEISVDLCCCTYKKGTTVTKSVSMSPDDAMARLNSIYNAAFIEKFQKAVPLNLCAKKNPLKTYGELCTELYGLHGEWEYFDKKNFVDRTKDLGFSSDSGFESEWKDACERQKDFFSNSDIM